MGGSSSEDSGGEESWVFYKDKPEWADVKPLPQDDGPVPVVAIAYSEKFRDVYDYFRAILKANEKSERALQLTVDALALNPANYSVWQYRREILKDLNKDLNRELEYVKNVIAEYPKNYQVWHHRKVIVEWIGSAGQELELTAELLKDDAKNYHAWQHRQWVMSTFRLFDNEMDYLNTLIDEDIRNNSAWNQRYFVVHHFHNFHSDVIASEIKYTLGKIKIAPKNESPWNYLRGLLVHCEASLSEVTVLSFSMALYREGCRSPHLLAYLVDLAIEQAELTASKEVALVYDAKKALGEVIVQFRAKIRKAPPPNLKPYFGEVQLVAMAGITLTDLSMELEPLAQICKDLADKHDCIRAEYWKYMGRILDNLILNCESAPQENK